MSRQQPPLGPAREISGIDLDGRKRVMRLPYNVHVGARPLLQAAYDSFESSCPSQPVGLCRYMQMDVRNRHGCAAFTAIGAASVYRELPTSVFSSCQSSWSALNANIDTAWRERSGSPRIRSSLMSSHAMMVLPAPGSSSSKRSG
jgi:hypothetical protein